MFYEDINDVPRDTETGHPIFQGQTLMALATLTNDTTDTIVSRTLVLPNLIVMFDVIGEGWQVGESIMCVPSYARRFIDEVLPEKAAKFDTCECEFHSDHTLTVEVPNAV